MFRVLSLIILLIAVGWFLYAVLAKKERLKLSLDTLLRRVGDSFTKFKNPRKLITSDIIDGLRMLSYFIAVLCVIILSLTGFIPPLLLGIPMSGFLLVLHVSLSPVFAICMTLLCLLWAHQQVFDGSDRQWLNSLLFGKDTTGSNLKYHSAFKICFWLLILLTPFVMGSIILSMYPVFGTHGQHTLLMLHRVSAFLFLAVSMIHTFLLIDSSVPEKEEE